MLVAHMLVAYVLLSFFIHVLSGVVCSDQMGAVSAVDKLACVARCNKFLFCIVYEVIEVSMLAKPCNLANPCRYDRVADIGFPALFGLLMSYQCVLFMFIWIG